jgi:exonuclease VII large subunit
MKIQIACLSLIVCALTLFNCFAVLAQNQPAQPPVQTPPPNFGANPAPANPLEILSAEMSQLRKSLQTMNKRLSEISERLAEPDVKHTLRAVAKQNKILLNLEVLTRAEQRAETMRKQLIELTEKENQLKARLAQVEEDSRPENINRNLNVVGTTRTPEIREDRRRYLETERSSLQNLIQQVSQNRFRLENEVQEADLLVDRLRKTVLPTIEKEIEIVNSN